jgi:diacylglycerol kinase family enzyme
MSLNAEIIVNPCSGGYSKGLLNKVYSILNEKFDFVTINYTNHSKHAEKLASDSKADILFIAGGDGLINEAVNGVINKECIIYPLAFGTSNVFCREYNIPVNPIKAAKRVNANELYHIPIGKINDRYFVKMTGFGFDARVVHNLNYYLRRLNSKFAHIISGVDVLLKNKFKQFHIYIKGNKISAYSSIISLGRKYAGNYDLVKRFFYNGFTICVIDNPGRKAIMENCFSVLFKKGVACDVYLYDSLQVTGIDYCQLDGEYFGLTNNRCEITLLKSNFFLASCSDNH